MGSFFMNQKEAKSASLLSLLLEFYAATVLMLALCLTIMGSIAG